jgi:hypothetical protein
MIDQVLWQQTVLMWARWWIEHPVQYRVFKVFDFLRTCLLYTILVCMFIPILPMLVIGLGAALIVALHWLLFQLYVHFFVKPAFMSYLLQGRSLEDLRTTDSCRGSAYLAGRRDLWVHLALRFPILG